MNTVILLVSAVITIVPLEDPVDVMLLFLESISAGNGELAASFISEKTLSLVDSMYQNDPEQVSYLLSGFGVQCSPDSMDEWNVEEYMALILSNKMLKGFITMVELDILKPLIEENNAFLDIEYEFLGNPGALKIHFVLEEEEWKIFDYTGIPPLR